ncbi:sensor histidine kinase [Domibacillus indicus]|uniref:sensor histidine kinase n=1 Tax=Domibacillus indicus TaxID=1437523 RepID=UPI00203F401E|nr:sensor histidine kinase [Domibacillus indicus]MCM3790883.1 sensor histidine kinase [Domibacillus indicus]
MQKNTSFYQQNLLGKINEQISMQKQSVEQVTIALSRNEDLQNYLQGTKDSYESYQLISEINTSFFNTMFSIPVVDTVDVYLESPPARVQEGPIRYFSFKDYQSIDWLQPMENADSAWLKKHIISSPQGNISVISFARKIYKRNGTAAGIVVVNTKTDRFLKLMNGEVDSRDRLLIDSSHSIIAYNGAGNVSEYLNAFTELSKDENVNVNGSSRQEEKFVVWSKLANSDWILIEVTPWNEIISGSVKLAQLLLFISLVTIGLIVILTYYLSKQFTKPINQLLQSMNDFSLKEREPKLPDDYRNEFGTLFRGYYKLNNRIKRLYSDLEQEYQQKRKAELDALQANINPHFLYNTLDQLNWMAIEEGQEKISRVLELMGRMFRIGLSKGEALIPLRDELVHLESYIQIQQIRLEGALNYQIYIPERYLHYYIPKLTLQPFIENAIIHGLRGQQQAMISINLHDVGEMMYIIIRDNGTGFSKDQMLNKRTADGGYGIKNVQDRLSAHFGANSSISIESQVGEGTTVFVKIPKKLHK